MIYLALFVAAVFLCFLYAFIKNRKQWEDREEDLYNGVRLTLKILGGVSIVLFLVSCFTIVPAGHVGVPVLFGRVMDTSVAEGMHTVNPFVSVNKLSVRTITYTMSGDSLEGKQQGDDAVYAISSDALELALDVTVPYRLIPQDAPWVYRNFGADYENMIIRPSARTAIRDASAFFTAQEIYATKRGEAAIKMRDLLEERIKSILKAYPQFKGRAIEVHPVMLREIVLPSKIKQAIEEKLSAEQEALRMEFVLQREEKEAERKRVEAKGIADFQKIVTLGISEPLLRWKGIEATEKLASSSNTKIVVIGAGKDGLPLILGQ